MSFAHPGPSLDSCGGGWRTMDTRIIVRRRSGPASQVRICVQVSAHKKTAVLSGDRHRKSNVTNTELLSQCTERNLRCIQPFDSKSFTKYPVVLTRLIGHIPITMNSVRLFKRCSSSVHSTPSTHLFTGLDSPKPRDEILVPSMPALTR